jgi:hypothetical protein
LKYKQIPNGVAVTWGVSGSFPVTLRSKAERISDESLLLLVSVFVHGYILWCAHLIHRESTGFELNVPQPRSSASPMLTNLYRNGTSPRAALALGKALHRLWRSASIAHSGTSCPFPLRRAPTFII